MNRAEIFARLSTIANAYLARFDETSAGFSLPGRRSGHAEKVDRLEGAARLAPALAALGNTSTHIDGTDQEAVREALARILAAGCRPSASGFWGYADEWTQIVCEASDISLALWMSRDWISDYLTEQDYDHVITWLQNAATHPVKQSNWLLFPLTIKAVLSRLGAHAGDDMENDLHSTLEQCRKWSVDDGMFRDGDDGEVDYYSFWGFHYNIGMIEWVLEKSSDQWLIDSRAASIRTLTHLMSPRGFPAFGRSLHYRMGVTAPLGIAMLRGDTLKADQIAMAKTALSMNWTWFETQGAMNNGLITQGFYRPDTDLIESYAGPGAPLWCLRSLIPLALLPQEDDYWSVAPQKLPVEQGDFEIGFGQQGWRVIGKADSQEIIIQTPYNLGDGLRFQRPSFMERIKGTLRGRTYYPGNFNIRYRRSVYRLTPYYTV